MKMAQSECATSVKPCLPAAYTSYILSCLRFLGKSISAQTDKLSVCNGFYDLVITLFMSAYVWYELQAFDTFFF